MGKELILIFNEEKKTLPPDETHRFNKKKGHHPIAPTGSQTIHALHGRHT
jgi:hypothetical protein